ncbi:MBOAT family protein [bacterium]|nr:MBOAT family protein [bacterium]
MSFQSLEFALFITLVFSLHWFILAQHVKLRNFFLLVTSYLFYGWWDWRFLAVLIGVSGSSYLIGLRIGRVNRTQGKKWLMLGAVVTLGALFYFKYLDFFRASFQHFCSLFGIGTSGLVMSVFVPIGISFQVFISLSYLIDIYRRKMEAEHNPVDMLLSVAFFPIVLSGPIQRPITLLPQFKKESVFNYNQVVDGLRQFLWGLFAKVVVADNIARIVDTIFNQSQDYSSSVLILGALFYSIQIYADFSGYSDMAIGLAKVLGINLMRNFRYPYFCSSLTDFWRRWHISMTTWFRDYLFLPLAYSLSRKIPVSIFGITMADMLVYIISALVTWFLTGLWHGDNYTFICWGLIHGFALILVHIFQKPRKHLVKAMQFKNKKILIATCDRFFAFAVILLGWVFFRADNVAEACAYLNGIVHGPLMISSCMSVVSKRCIFFGLLYFVVEWIQREKQHGLEFNDGQLGLFWRWLIYYALIAAIVLYGASTTNPFLYFQF